MKETLSLLKAELKKATAEHYRKLVSDVPDIYGYSLYTCDDIPGVGPVANRESAISVEPTDKMYLYYRYLAVEWSEWNDFGMFDGVNNLIRTLREDESVEFSETQEAVLRTCLEALVELEDKGTFGPRTDRRFVVICIADSDDAIMMESAEMLNNKKVFKEYASQF